MKIGFFTNTYLPNHYGSTMSIELFRKGLEDRGHEIFVFAPGWKGYEDKNPNVFRYPAVMSKYKIKYPIAFSISSRISKKVKELNLDIIHSHQAFSVAKDGQRQARCNNIPAVFTHHCRYEDYTHYLLPILPQRTWKWYVKRKATQFANKSDLVIAPSNSIKEMIRRRGVKSKIEVLSTGIQIKKFKVNKREEMRKKYRVKDDEILLMNLGRIDEEKNIMFLIRAAIKTMKKYSRAKFLLVGDGSLREEIIEKFKKEGLAERAIITGLIEHKEVPSHYDMADIFLHTSLSETQGIILVEAMISGVAVVAIKATGVVDAVEDRKTGILTDNNFNQFVSAIGELMENEKERLRLSKSAQLVSEDWSYQKQAEKAERLYQELIEKNKKIA